jgi:aminoglycoside phosphotransferase (APT) family kinase protein
VLAIGQSGELFDVPFFIMAYVPGLVIGQDMPAAFSTALDANAMGLALVDTLVSLHAVDWRAVGLEGFGRPDGFNRRHLHRIAALVRGDDGGLPRPFADLFDWLDQHAPAESGATILHNDFRLGNVMWAAEPPARVVAILDWELATLGDPLFDLAYLLASTPQAGAIPTPTQAFALATLRPGFPSRSALAARYIARSGRDLDRLGWYMAMVNWKLAALYAFSRQRGIDPYYDAPDQVCRFLEEARRHAVLDS